MNLKISYRNFIFIFLFIFRWIALAEFRKPL